MTQDFASLLKPYRARIDALDEQIIDLLRLRYDVIEEVGRLKARENIPATLQDRVDEVRENAARLGAAKGLDESFIRDLYARLITHSCALEEAIAQDLKTRKAS
ncbi:MAG: chorismate mutase [Alphaproteobacteria bacterium]|nr:chorismate mutase [Alphaproteobacteria bacterium]